MTKQTIAVLEALLDDPASWHYGYDLSRSTDLKSGTLYPILIRLSERGWLDHEWRHEDGQKPRHMYRLTAHGRKSARLALEEVRTVNRLRLAHGTR